MKPARTALGLIAALGLLPWLVADYHRLFAAEILVWGLLAMSFGMVYGYGGMLSFAQAVFFGWGCWGYNVASFLLQWNTWGALALAMVAALASLAIPKSVSLALPDLEEVCCEALHLYGLCYFHGHGPGHRRSVWRSLPPLTDPEGPPFL